MASRGAPAAAAAATTAGTGAVRALSWLASAALAVGPTVGFLVQARQIQLSGRLNGFSPWVCLLLFAAHILRIFFWIFRQFDLALLFQSCLIIAVQLWLLYVCVRAQRHVALERRQPLRRLRDRVLADFWRWDAFEDYVIVLAGFFWALCCLTYIASMFGDQETFTEVLGIAAVAFEIAFPLPQVRKIFSTGSAAGVSWEMVATWWIGDVLKTAYFVLSEAPVQFFVCGLFQLMLDTVLLGQLIVYYRKDPANNDEALPAVSAPVLLVPISAGAVAASR